MPNKPVVYTISFPRIQENIFPGNIGVVYTLAFYRDFCNNFASFGRLLPFPASFF
jgi:hypothetical protein